MNASKPAAENDKTAGAKDAERAARRPGELRIVAVNAISDIPAIL